MVYANKVRTVMTEDSTTVGTTVYVCQAMWDLSLDTDFLKTTARFFFNADLHKGICGFQKGFCEKGTTKNMPTYANWRLRNADLGNKFSMETHYRRSGLLSRGRLRQCDELRDADLAGVYCSCVCEDVWRCRGTKFTGIEKYKLKWKNIVTWN